MKTPNDDLFQLIHSMTAAEKRYFKRHYASEKNQTTELFDFVNGMDSYQEVLVKNNFSGSKLAKNLKVYKVQLSELILKSLTSYRNKKNIESKIRIGLEEFDILVEKKLYGFAYKKLVKLKQVCDKYKADTYLLEISEKAKQLKKKVDLDKGKNKLHSNNKQSLDRLYRKYSTDEESE